MAEYTSFSFMRPRNGDGDEPKKKQPLSENEKIAIAQNEREKMLEYMRHPSYKERLKKEMFRDSFNQNDKRNVDDLEEEYATRMKEISTIPISRGKFDDVGKYLYGEYFPVRNDGPSMLSREVPGGRKGEIYKLGAPQIIISEDEFSSNMLQNPLLYRQVVGHELGHSTNRGVPGAIPMRSRKVPKTHIYEALEQHSLAPEALQREAVSRMIEPEFMMERREKERKKIEELATKRIGPEKTKMILDAQEKIKNDLLELRNKYGKSYNPDVHGYPESEYPEKELYEIQNPIIHRNLENSPAEVSTRMIGLRRLASEKFGHNMNEDFDIRKYKDQIQDYFKKNGMIDEYRQLSKDLGLSDDQINEMMKYIAKAERQPSVSRYTG